MRRGVMLMVIACLPRGAHADIDGRIRIARGVGKGFKSSADAAFAHEDLLGAEIGRDGPCTVHARPPHGHLSAGTIEITGTAEPITLEEERALDGSVSYRHTKPVPDPAFVDAGTITVNAAGGADVPAFSVDVTAPTKLTGYTPPTSLSRDGYTATWTAGNGAEIMIMVGAVNKTMMHGVVVLCRVPDTGTFTIPASTFGLIPPVDFRAIVMIGRVAKKAQLLADAHVEIEVIDGVGSGPFILDSEAVAQGHDRRAVLHENTPRRFFGVSSGFGGLSRVGATPPLDGFPFRLQFGQRLAHGVHLVEESDFTGSGYITATTYEDNLSVAAGVRWTPFEPRPNLGPSFSIFPGRFIDIRAFYLTATLGLALRSRMTTPTPISTPTSETDTLSPMASLAIGLLEIQGYDWSLGPEFREQLARYDGTFQRGWQLLIAIHVNDW